MHPVAKTNLQYSLSVAVFLLLAVGGSRVQSGESAVEFDRAVLPHLRQHCIRCHGNQRQEGDFRIDELSHDVGGGGDANRWLEVIEKINNGEMPPEDEPDRPTAEEGGRVVKWLAAKTQKAEAARLPRGNTSMLRGATAPAAPRSRSQT